MSRKVKERYLGFRLKQPACLVFNHGAIHGMIWAGCIQFLAVKVSAPRGIPVALEEARDLPGIVHTTRKVLYALVRIVVNSNY